MLRPTRVMLMTTPTLFRQCLAAVLRRRRQFEVVGDAATGPDAASKARLARPDVIVLDAEVPEGGPTILAGLREEFPDCALLVLTSNKDEGVVRGALTSGARGYLDEDCEIDDVVRSIERVRAGELVVSPAVAEAAVKGLAAGAHHEEMSSGLTLRQLEVVRLVTQGQTNAAIGRELFITKHTVKAHLVNIQGRLGLGNRVQLTAYAVEHNLAASPHAAT